MAEQSAYRHVVNSLLSRPHVFYSPPASPHKLHIQPQEIASFSLHPVIESLLHILNCDLPSAHFLCRHAEVKPKWESMYVHGILHRVEGDIDNTRAWYGDVKDSEMFATVWHRAANKDEVPEIASLGFEHFLDRLEAYRDRTKKRAAAASQSESSTIDAVQDWTVEEHKLRETSLWEIKTLLSLCEDKFGTSAIKDAREEFLGKIESGDAELAKQAESMVTGGEGWRTF
jgi:hypothetical protein